MLSSEDTFPFRWPCRRHDTPTATAPPRFRFPFLMSPSPQNLAPTTAWSWKKATLLIFGVLFLFTELALRIIHVPALRQRLNPIEFEESRSPLQAHPYTAYTCKPNFQTPASQAQHASHNSFGFRGPETTWSKPEGVLRVVCLGGSSTYGEGVSDNEHTWPAKLESLLSSATSEGQYEVINLGVPGYSSFESLGRFAFMGLELKPDVVVIYHSMADVRSALSEEPTPDNTHYRANWPTTYQADMDRLFAVSRSFSLIRSYLQEEPEEKLTGRASRTFVGSARTGSDLPSVRGFTNFQRNLRGTIALAQSIGAEVILVSQAVDQRDLQSNPNFEEQTLALRRMSQILTQLSRQPRVTFVDAASIFEVEASRQIELRGSENLFAWQERLRDSGAHLLALTIADAVLHTQSAH